MSDRPSKHPDSMRRQVVTALAGSVALAACGGTGGVDSGGSGGPGGSTGKTPLPVGTIPPDRAGLPRPVLPDPALSGIDHIVLVTMENRSFDHLLGWLPNAEGLPPNRFGLPNFYELHYWLYKSNPSGTFSDWNPTVSCRGKGDNGG